MMKVMNILAFSLLLFIGTQAVAQDTPATPSAEKANELDSLKLKLDNQEKSLARLQQVLQEQAELIKSQQGKIDALEQKAGRSTAPVSGESKADVEMVKAVAKTEAKDSPQPPAKKADSAANGVEAGYGKIKFNGLLQGWFAAGNAGTADTFRIRRIEMKFTGSITPKIKWTLMVDPSKALSTNNTYTNINGRQVMTGTSVNQAGRILQDAFITYSHNKKFNVNVGQFKVPLGLEGLQSSAALDTVERALFLTDKGRGGALGDARDLGVMAYGSLAPQLDYQIGLFNGSGENFNDVDKNDQKAVAGRLVYRPTFIKGLQVGASGATNAGSVSAARPRRDRFGAEMFYVNRNFTFKSEFVRGTDGDLHRRGYYTHFGYRVAPKVEIIGRFDSFDPDTRVENNAGNVTERDYIAGVNYFIVENKFKFQANYLRKTYTNSLSPARNLLMLNLQTSW